MLSPSELYLIMNYLSINMLILCQACNYHLWSLRHREFITVDIANTITCSMVDSRFNYCHSILYKTTKAIITIMCTEQSCSCNVAKAKMHTRLLVQLHWLPVSYHIEYKIALIMC